jgi:hypothetical protein
VPNVTIKYGDDLFYCEGDHDEVCKAILDGKPLTVFSECITANPMHGIKPCCTSRRITFFGDPDWVAMEL